MALRQVFVFSALSALATFHVDAFTTSSPLSFKSQNVCSVLNGPHDNCISAVTLQESNLRFKSKPHNDSTEDEIKFQQRRKPLPRDTCGATIERERNEDSFSSKYTLTKPRRNKYNSSVLDRGTTTKIRIHNPRNTFVRPKMRDSPSIPFKYSHPIKSSDVPSRSQGIEVHLVDISWLKPHEEVVSKERVQSLSKAIMEWNAYKLPLLVDTASGAILDGHHRYAVGCEMGLSKLPVILVDYLQDDTIEVDVWEGCGQDDITKEEIIAMSLSDNVYPPKTSKHDFVDLIKSISIPLPKLL